MRGFRLATAISRPQFNDLGSMAMAGTPDVVGFWPRFRSLFALLPCIAAFAVMLVSPPIVPSGSWAQFDLDSLAWLSFIAGAVFRWWGAIYLASSARGVLVTAGPFSICRHPIHLGNLLLGLSLVMFVGSATLALGFALAAAAYLMIVLRAEERWLEQRYGGRFREYCRRVPPLVIRPARFQSPETIFVSARDLVLELRRAAFWMWLPVIGKTLAQFRAETWWPHLLRLP
jgi:protein-S-isoprenylcysteine O-methyltransferase Ste14